jgi:hypothetical protein
VSFFIPTDLYGARSGTLLGSAANARRDGIVKDDMAGDLSILMKLR